VAATAESTVRDGEETEPARLLDRLDRALKGSVGAAAGVARVELASQRLVFAGVGNVVARVLGREEIRFVSAHGILGQRFRTPPERSVRLEAQDLLVMHSDGISDRFDSNVLPELSFAPAATIAALLLSRYGKQHDDASCLVARVVP
jgi:serine/threonine protein phosphatase PrpC